MSLKFKIFGHKWHAMQITQAQSAAKTQDATDAILEIQKSFEAMKARMEHMEKGIIQHNSNYSIYGTTRIVLL